MGKICQKGLITDNLVLNMDVSDVNITDTGKFSIESSVKWKNATSDNINLYDFGLTAFDNGLTDNMSDYLNIRPDDLLVIMSRVGFNEVTNPADGETSAYSATTYYDNYEIAEAIDYNNIQYLKLDGGYLQGYFSLEGYNQKLLPTRYGSGITIENLIKLDLDSNGIFFMMGVRSEDKYSPHFSGETKVTGNAMTYRIITNIPTAEGQNIDTYTGGTEVDNIEVIGVLSSENNTLDGLNEKIVNKSAFRKFEEKDRILLINSNNIDNIKSNVIAFEIIYDRDTDKRYIGYKYIDSDGHLVVNRSNNHITAINWTLVSITFTPNEIITSKFDLKCKPQRLGTLAFYVNGRLFWKVEDFPEFLF